MIQYRKLTDLTDEEICFILTELFNPIKIENIWRDEFYEEITAEITTEGWGNDNMQITDIVELSYNEFRIDFNTNVNDLFRYRQYLLAKGCDKRLKNNPYLKD